MTELVPMAIPELNPRHTRGVQVIGQNHERVERPAGAQPETSHPRLVPPRRILVSNAKTRAIRTAFPGWAVSDDALPAWVVDSVILWAGELVEFEMSHRTDPHLELDDARAICALGYVGRPVPRGAYPFRDHLLPSRHAPS